MQNNSCGKENLECQILYDCEVLRVQRPGFALRSSFKSGTRDDDYTPYKIRLSFLLTM